MKKLISLLSLFIFPLVAEAQTTTTTLPDNSWLIQGDYTGKWLSLESDSISSGGSYLNSYHNAFRVRSVGSAYKAGSPTSIMWAGNDGTLFSTGIGSNGQIIQSNGTTWSWVTPTYLTSVPAQSFSSLTGKPTTLTGYGIIDAYPLSGNPSGFLTSVPAQSFSSLTGRPTTLSGYGITDAYPLSGNPLGFLIAEVDGSTTNEIELPSQTGNSGKVPVTNGSTIAWTAFPVANFSAPSVGNSITSGTAFQPNASAPCMITINGNLSGVVGLLSTVTIAVSATQNGTYTTIATDQLVVAILSVAVDKSLATIPVRSGYWVKVTQAGVGTPAFTYSRCDVL